jgi:hypothetical protein
LASFGRRWEDGVLARRLTPILNVSDIQQSFAWFDKLGWKKAWDWDSPPTFGERLRFFHQMRSHAEMLEFRIGDRVAFQPEGQSLVVGMLTRYNKKSVTVITDTGQRWNVAPRFLRGVSEKRGDTVREPNVIQLRKR